MTSSRHALAKANQNEKSAEITPVSFAIIDRTASIADMIQFTFLGALNFMMIPLSFIPLSSEKLDDTNNYIMENQDRQLLRSV